MQVDPKAMDAMMEREGRGANRYQKSQVAPSVDPELDFDEQDFSEEELAFNPNDEYYQPPQAAQRPQAQPPRMEAKHTQDEELAPGLFRSDVNSWKKQFGECYYVEVKGQGFVFRPLERFEYKEIIATPNTDPLIREEMICEYCVLYPQAYTFDTMTNQKAGIPAVLSEIIMDHSGFTRDVKVQKL